MPASMKSLMAAKRADGRVSTVLGLWKQDKRYYNVLVTDCDMEARNCQVVFEDGYKCWLEAKELHCELDFDKLKEEEIVCCVCESGSSDSPNVIIMCDSCQQGYHVICHEPSLDPKQVKPDDDQVEWVCNTCGVISNYPDEPPVASSSSSGSSSSARKRGSRKSTNGTIKKTPAKPKPEKTSKRAIKATIEVATPKIKLNKRTTLTQEATPVTIEPVKEKKLKEQSPCPEEAQKSVVVSTDSNSGRLEKMSPLIIEAAQKLAMNSSCMDTNEFVQLIGTDPKAIKELYTPSKGAGRKRNKSNTAAAF